MSIKGFQGTSLLDFPERIASLIFFGGCNLSCPYCHNPALVESPDSYPTIPISEVLEQLRARQGFIDGVVVSGGEPTLDRELATLLREIKQMGLQVKLDTNGLRPDVLTVLLTEQLVDYVGLDVKTSLPRYGELHSRNVDFGQLAKSIALLKEATIEVEFRTTCAPGLIEAVDIHAIGQSLKGAPLWVLQQFVPDYALAQKMRDLAPHSDDSLRKLADIAGEYVANVKIRGL